MIDFTEKNRLVRLEMTTNGHNKFYEVEIRISKVDRYDKYEVWIHWGRIGNTGSWRKNTTCTNFFSARIIAKEIITQKEHRGYQKVEITDKKETTQPKQKVVDKQYARFLALLE